jgi:hypothetical protein
MSATEMFESSIGHLDDEQRKKLEPLISRARADLFASRSEEARLRTVDQYIEEARSWLRNRTPGS